MDVFFIENYYLLEKYNSILNKFSNNVKKELDCEPVYNKTFQETKIKSYGDEATDFHDKEIPKLRSNYTCLAVILIDFVLKKMKTIIRNCF